jgi:hypothetical protein
MVLGTGSYPQPEHDLKRMIPQLLSGSHPDINIQEL